MSINVCNDRSMASITNLPSGVAGGSLVLLSTQTASSSSTISFTSGIDSTYKEYIFKYTDIHPATNGSYFEFNMSADSGSNYNVTKTSTAFEAYHNENDASAVLTYDNSQDLAQSTSFNRLTYNQSNANDAAASGCLHLFDPSSTTFVKHFINVSNSDTNDYSIQMFHAGYGNTTSAIDAIQFKMNSGNIDAGTIKMYGVV